MTNGNNQRGVARVAGHRDVKLAPEVQRTFDSLLRHVGRKRAAALLGTGASTLEQLAGGGAAKADTVARVTAALGALAFGSSR